MRRTLAIALLVIVAPLAWLVATSPAHAQAVASSAHAQAEGSSESPIQQEMEHGSAGQPHEGPAGPGEKEAEEPPELPNLIHLVYRALTRPAEPGEAPRPIPQWLALLNRFQSVVYALASAAILIIVCAVGSRRMQMIPGPIQNVVEAFIDGFHDFIFGILGPAGERYIPFLGSLFLYIWFMNLFGLVPLMQSPTSMLSTTGALAIVVFLYVQAIGIRRLGPLTYMRHLAGDPQDKLGWALVPLMLPLHVISEFARPVSLSLRLFGNILGEDMLIGVFAGLGVAVVAFIRSPVGVPLHLPFILLALLMSTVQALVFTLLTAIYIMQVLPHEGAHEDEPEDAGVRAAVGERG